MRDHLSFVLNGEAIELRGLAPAATLLTYLQRRLAGTEDAAP